MAFVILLSIYLCGSGDLRSLNGQLLRMQLHVAEAQLLETRGVSLMRDQDCRLVRLDAMRTDLERGACASCRPCRMEPAMLCDAAAVCGIVIPCINNNIFGLISSPRKKE